MQTTKTSVLGAINTLGLAKRLRVRILQTSTSERSMPGDFPNAVNLGNPTEIRIGKQAEEIISLTGSRSRVKYRPLPQDDPRQRCPDIRRAHGLLNRAPRMALQAGLKRTIAYFEDVLAKGLKPETKLAGRAA